MDEDTPAGQDTGGDAEGLADVSAAGAFADALKEAAENLGPLSLRKLHQLSQQRHPDGARRPGHRDDGPHSYHWTTVRRYLAAESIAPEDFIDLLAWISASALNPLAPDMFTALRALRQKALAESPNAEDRLEHALHNLSESDFLTDRLRRDLADSADRIADYADAEDAIHRRVQQLRTVLDGPATDEPQARRNLLEELARLETGLREHRGAYDLALERQARLRAQLDTAQANAAGRSEMTQEQALALTAAADHAKEIEASWLRKDAETRGMQSQLAELTRQLRLKDEQIARHAALRARAIRILARVTVWLVTVLSGAAGLWTASLWAGGFALPGPAHLRVPAFLLCSAVLAVGAVLLVLPLGFATLIGAERLWTKVSEDEPFTRARPLRRRLIAGVLVALAAALLLAAAGAALLWAPSTVLHLAAWLARRAGLPVSAPADWSAVPVAWSAAAGVGFSWIMLRLFSWSDESGYLQHLRQQTMELDMGFHNATGWGITVGPYTYWRRTTNSVVISLPGYGGYGGYGGYSAFVPGPGPNASQMAAAYLAAEQQRRRPPFRPAALDRFEQEP